MDQKTGIKGRRQKRIRTLLDDHPETEAIPQLFVLPEKTSGFREWADSQGNVTEPDPEKLWKERKGGWKTEEGGEGPHFAAGFIRRTVASLIVFGAVWGIFTARQPWALQTQAFITDALSKDMDFAAVQVWYGTYFNGAPSFIPIFGEEEEPAQKVTAGHELSAPLEGEVIHTFASTLKGIEILPADDSSSNVTVKSVDTGRVLSVSKETGGGIRIVIRHTGSVTAEYGHLSGTKLAADDWVQSGDTVGWMQETENLAHPLLYFAILKDKTYIDPTEVVSFD